MDHMAGRAQGWLWLAALAFSLLGPAPFAQADSQRLVEYEYDAAGNLIRIRSGKNLGPPQVSELRPAFIHQDQTASVRVNGANLYGAEIGLAGPGLSLLSVSRHSSSLIDLIVAADANAAIGTHTLIFTTALGNAVGSLRVSRRTPVISTYPSPIVIRPDGQTNSIELSFEASYASTEVFEIGTTDPLVASATPSTVVLPAGATELELSLSGLTEGTTSLEITQPANFLALAIPLTVSNGALPADSYGFQARAVGVVAYVPSVHDVYADLFSNPLGVAAYAPLPATDPGLFPGPAVGLAYGPVLDGISPRTFARGGNYQLTVAGLHLDEVTDVAFAPAEGISASGPPVPTADGRVLTLPLTIAADAATGMRAVVLLTASGGQAFSEGLLTIE